MEDAPTLLDRLEAEDAEHFEEVRALLDRERRLLRRSTRPWSAASTTTRAPCSSSSASGSAPSRGIGGGGRYDGLIEQLGGPPTPGCGWALGVERIALALATEAEAAAAQQRTASSSSPRTTQRERALALVDRAAPGRASAADLDLAGRALRAR